VTFQKGISGNPAGRPKTGQAMAEVLRAIADLSYKGTGRTYREQAAHMLWEQACAGRLGSLEALKFIVERTDGKVPDRLDAEVSGEVGVVVRGLWRKPLPEVSEPPALPAPDALDVPEAPSG
jgi:hypothetical protein